ncbi:uncharacterized protein LOC112539421 [Tetranychus urticae]|uniref:uncharacterized protein LOC112539421 n=1 Tax=Tetranychus urticae TaxID=32264 RepID=UPI0003566C1C|nr:uncharacterized protein LOC112539421 [Tetranychus urticae]
MMKKESVYCPDQSSLRYLDLPKPVSINCLKGYDKNSKYGHEQPKGTNLLRWILENETIVRNFDYDFICSNGLLKDLMISSLYSFDWSISAVKIRGKIILSKSESIERERRIYTQSETDNKSTYAASNLQRLITKNNNQCSSGREGESFYGVFHSKIGSHRILNSGYLDCVESEQELKKSFDDMKFVLIKKFNGPKISHSIFQANSWWSLATLADVGTVIRAECDRSFVVNNIDKLEVDNLINEDRKMTFFASLNSILDHFKLVVTEENKCYNFHFNGEDKMLTGYMKMDADENLIPLWYIDQQLPL